MDKKSKKIKIAILVIVLIAITTCGVVFGLPLLQNSGNVQTGNNNSTKIEGKIDDWEYKGTSDYDDLYSTQSTRGLASIQGVSSSKGVTSMATEDSMASNNIGLATGGAKDANNFRENIKNGYFPISTDITYNGLFYDYYFDTTSSNKQTDENQIFSPSYSTAISKDPVSKQDEYYMTVGLNSNIKESDFVRKKLNLVVVLDISGSMGSSFNKYYYDGKNDEYEEDKTKSKMTIANEAVNILIDQLKDDDRLGMVLFDNNAYIAKKMNLIANTDVAALKNHVLDIKAKGGTNFGAGYSTANELLKEYEKADSDEYENRIIVITDAMPNIGKTSKQDLFSMISENSAKGTYTTFVGVGVDFNTEIIEKLSDTKGANYYSVHSSKEFKERMGEQFEYMVTPLVFDLNLKLSSTDYEIEKVYGSDTADAKSGNLMKINTLFPSKSSSNGEVKGGVVLLKLKKLNQNAQGNLKLEVSYKDRNQKDFSNSQIVTFNNKETEKYENTGIRKAIVLTRYANAIKNWILYERSEDDRFLIIPSNGIIDCDYKQEEIRIMLGENERKSQELSVSEKYKEVFKIAKEYIAEQNKELQDETLNQEIEILDILINK